ncbi:adenosylmethionine--8-amino-7-oxononanoate transaminase [Oleidesulfovibrio alaskensis]|uniref:adenosylmethionine--8-amino-7-oxononanoate transaminase n=1 Tax=Oleidesulfovibrio alaskensis TaxID=58180 RepID=UPI0003FF010C|nr:adenosylmethionine--8-amino-7-oxononanoate transaminase [Oleidesulfovibrio alaskensis]
MNALQPDTERLRALDAAHVWHPFTQMATWHEDAPLIIEKARGNWLVDTDGNRYLDGVSSLWTNVHGHRHPHIDAAIRAQLDNVAHSTLLGLSSRPAIELAAMLARIAPQGLNRVFYSDSGSTAVEVALKIAYQYQKQRGPAGEGRSKFLCLRGAYHGDTVGAVSLGGIDLFHAVYGGLLFETVRAEAPYCYRCPFGRQKESCRHECFTHLEETATRHAPELAAMVIEPLVQGAAGQITHPDGYLAHARALCDRLGILLIADEVAVGFGKTGTMFACEQEKVAPDLLCLAKGISGGYLPLAATMVTDAVYEAFLGDHAQCRTFFHGHTYTGNALACAAGIASLQLFRTESTLERLQHIITIYDALLRQLETLPHVGDIRRRGIMTGIELVEDRATRRPYPFALRTAHKVVLAARRRGVIIRPLGDVLVLMPPLSITAQECGLLVEATAEAIQEVTGGPRV